MHRRTLLPIALSTLTLCLLRASPAPGQTDYHNTDAGRPVLIEDAYPVERYAFEAQIAPLRLERSDDGVYHWEVEPELVYGILPGTHVEVGMHLDFTDQAEAGRALAVQSVNLGMMHNLNAETLTWPALAVAADARFPVDHASHGRVYTSAKGIATRSFRPVRLHVNAEYTFGPSQVASEVTHELSRWMAGLAIDRAFPLHGALLIAGAYVEEGLAHGAERQWTVEAGARYQLDVFFALDVGTGRRLTGGDPAWFVTVGAARTFGIRSLMGLSGNGSP